jgi:NADPH:quinone reductase-like Zn-dependent oxidoreductase
VNKTDWLRELGAAGVLLWDDFNAAPDKPLLSQEWAGGIDTLGGPALERILRSLQFGGAVAACGNALSGSLNLSMYPFILRGISLAGIASADTPLVEKRRSGSFWLGTGGLKIITNLALSFPLRRLIVPSPQSSSPNIGADL